MKHVEILQRRVERIVKHIIKKLHNQYFLTTVESEVESECRDLLIKGIISDFQVFYEEDDGYRTYFLMYKMSPLLNSKKVVVKIHKILQ